MTYVILLAVVAFLFIVGYVRHTLSVADIGLNGDPRHD